MDKVIEIHTEQRVFVGSTPKTILDAYKEACLVLGYSASQFAKNAESTELSYPRMVHEA